MQQMHEDLTPETQAAVTGILREGLFAVQQQGLKNKALLEKLIASLEKQIEEEAAQAAEAAEKNKPLNKGKRAQENETKENETGKSLEGNDYPYPFKRASCGSTGT